MGITAHTDIRIGPGDITITTAMMGTAMDTGTMGTGDRICLTTAMMGTAMSTGDRICLTTAGTAGNDGALTPCLPPQARNAWRVWATHRGSTLQRASSAVEGRNGALAQLHHHQRGVPKHRDKVWTVRQNFDGHVGVARHPPRAFAGGHFRISLPQPDPTSMPCLNRGGENPKSYYAIEVIACPALSGYPACCEGPQSAPRMPCAQSHDAFDGV